MDDDEILPIVIDCGSGFCKAGFGGDDAPRSYFSSVVGRQRFSHEEIAMDNVVGDEAQIMREFMCLKYPIERGIVSNWDDAEKLWDFCFKDLRVDPTSQPILMSEPVFNPAGNKERLAEYMFERFQVPGFFSNDSATLSLFYCGRGVGLIVDVGEDVTQVVPIHFTSPTPQAVVRQELGGRDVTLYLRQLLHERGYSFSTTAELEYVREIKEELCYTSLDFNHEISQSTEETPFVLPDGNKFTIRDEKFKCAECLFQPSLAGHHNLKGLHELLKSCIENCDIDIRKDFYCNVILCGGGSLMRNFAERLDKLWKACTPSTMVTRVVARVDRKYSVWIGGSIVASLSTFQQAWITKQEYEEFGPTIVHRRCL